MTIKRICVGDVVKLWDSITAIVFYISFEDKDTVLISTDDGAAYYCSDKDIVLMQEASENTLEALELASQKM